MVNLFDNFNIYTKKFCNNLQNEVQNVFINKEDTDGKVYVCAISRKTPKLLDILQVQYAQLEIFWDKIVIVTEIALPFLQWDKIKKVILVDDAIYFGSTFTAIYRQIQRYAPHVKTVPMCCIRASEADLDFDKELRATVVPRSMGLYFVNCLSIVFRKQCKPFEVEFPVFHIGIPKINRYKANLFLEILQKTKLQVYDIDYHTGDYVTRGEEKRGYKEIGIDLAHDGNICKKIRLYVRKDEILISSICAQPILQSDLCDNSIFQNTIYQDIWEHIKNAVKVKHTDDETMRSLCVAINFINSISVFFNTWELIRNCISSAFDMEFSRMKVELLPREINLLFGQEIGHFFSQWYQSHIISQYEQLLSKTNIQKAEGLDEKKEYLPHNLPFKNYYFEIQERFLLKFNNTSGVMTSLFYIQNLMLDKKNRMFYAINNERLKYGHTFGSLSSLKDRAELNGEKSNLEMHAWVDANIDAASIVPQYIKGRTNNMKEVWLRVFRSGENELHFLSHWARLSVAILKKEMELTGAKMMDISFFSGMLTWIYDKYSLDLYFGDGAEKIYSENCYSVSVNIGDEKLDVVDVLERLEIINVFRENGILGLNNNLVDSDIMNSSILPDGLTDDIDTCLERLAKDIPMISNYFYYIPFFDAVLYNKKDVMDYAKSIDIDNLFEKTFEVLKRIYSEKSEDLQESKKYFFMQSKFLKMEFVALNTHKTIWDIDDEENNRNLSAEIYQNRMQILKNGFFILLKVVEYAHADTNGEKLIKYTNSLNGRNFDFLKKIVTETTYSGFNRVLFLHKIILSGYKIWKF